MLPVIFINMTRKVIISIAALSFSFTSETYSKQIIENTNNQFNSVDDYKVNMQVELDVPAFRMPKKKYKVFYKNPNKIKVKAKGFGILPKTGLFTSPNDNFDNLSLFLNSISSSSFCIIFLIEFCLLYTSPSPRD